MKSYKSASGKKSGATGYEIGPDFIDVQFQTKIYRYSYNSAGKEIIEKMKNFALTNKGLSTFISQNHPPFEKKLR